MNSRYISGLVALVIVGGSSLFSQPAKAGCGGLDITCEGSDIRGTLRRLDPTSPTTYPARILKKSDPTTPGTLPNRVLAPVAPAAAGAACMYYTESIAVAAACAGAAGEIIPSKRQGSEADFATPDNTNVSSGQGSEGDFATPQ